MDDVESYSVAALVAPHPLAAGAGRDVLIEGGSVIEAAIAAAAVSAVVVPHRNGLGGDALWLIREAGMRGRVRVLDARGSTGDAAMPARFRGQDVVPQLGSEAVLAAPGAVGGWAAAHELSTALGGRLSVARLLAPALAAAQQGVAVGSADVAALMHVSEAAKALPGFGPAFLADGLVPEAGTLRRWPALAGTLQYLLHSGLDDLYRGDIARELGADLEEMECPLTRSDLRRAEPRWRRGASLDLGRRGVDVASNGPGLALAVTLGLFAGLGDIRPDGFDHRHGLLESAKLARRLIQDTIVTDRDPAGLVDADHLRRQSLRIDRGRAAGDLPWAAPLLDEEAVWIGAVGRDGMAVSLVQSLGGAFGSGVVSGRTGLLLGNRGAALSLDPQRGPGLWPGRRPPLLSVPALVAARDGGVTSLGATGPEAGAVAAGLGASLMLGARPGDALAAPRLVFGAAPEGPEAAVLVDEAMDSGVAARLRAAGHRLEPAPRRTTGAGACSRLPSGRLEAHTAPDAADGATGL